MQHRHLQFGQGIRVVLPLGEREEAGGLRAALAYDRVSPGPVIPHRILGPLTRDEWDRFELLHLANHLSFAIPR
jgi:hypothetical protein